MPPLPRKAGTPGITPRKAVRGGLRLTDELVQFEFQPSIGIGAGQIDRMGLDIRSFREPLKRVVQKVMAPSFRKNFEEEGRPDQWAEPSPETLDIRERQGFGDRILDRTGLLKKTIQQLNIWTITSTNATIQDLPAKISYGKIHQAGYGGKGGGVKMSSYLKKAGGDAKEAQKLLDDDLIMAMRSGTKMHQGARNVPAIPQRQFVLIQDEDYDAIEEIFVEWLTERAVASGAFRRG